MFDPTYTGVGLHTPREFRREPAFRRRTDHFRECAGWPRQSNRTHASIRVTDGCCATGHHRSGKLAVDVADALAVSIQQFDPAVEILPAQDILDLRLLPAGP